MKKLTAAVAAAVLVIAPAAFAADDKPKAAIAEPKAAPKATPKPETKPEAKPEAKPTPAPKPDTTGLKTDDEKAVYALGVLLSRNIATFNLTPAEAEIVVRGLSDGIKQAPKLDADDYRSKIGLLSQARQEQIASVEKKKGEEFLAKMAKEPGAKKTESGIVIIEQKAGTGESPKATDKVKVHYHGTLIDGTVFDSSVERKEPATFPLNGVIKCWTEGVQTMKVGGKSRLVCPSDLAYGNNGAGPKIKPGSTLVFDVELLEIVK